MDAVMTIPEVAAALRISRPAVYPLIHKGELKTTDVGAGKRSRTRVYARSVEDLLKRRSNA
jgi:excisionase family DNA binding protein